jgi:hypothetical protein
MIWDGSVDSAVRTIADWRATPNGTPSFYLLVPDREAADMLANEIAYRLNLGTSVEGPSSTLKGGYAVVMDRE